MEKRVEASIVPIIQGMGGSNDNIVDIIEQSESSLEIESKTKADYKNQLSNISLKSSEKSFGAKHSNDNDNHLYCTPESITSEKNKNIENFNYVPLNTKIECKNQVVNTKETLSENHKYVDNKCQTHLPMLMIMGGCQLILSITMAALGGLVIARNASLSLTFSGIWAGAIAGVTGSLSIINLKSVQTSFLASSLISVATGTLALSLTGIGLLRDWNVLQQDEVS